MGLNINILKGQIRLVTGMHIGAGSDDIHIGGVDNPVVKDRDGFPYIPGSSLKGKLRSLLEISEGAISYNGNPSTTIANPGSMIPVLFGDTSGKNITRLLFRDSFLSEKSKAELIENSILATEEKSENFINRLKGVAENPRKTERAISGLIFDFEIIVRVFENDSEEEFKKKLLDGIELLEKDALGGSGSRGYGKVVFLNMTWNDVPIK